MQWSQLKKRVEETFADEVKERLEVWVTRYRHAHDGAGEAWITLDKQKIVTMGNLRFQIAHAESASRLRQQGNCLDYRDPTQAPGYREAWDEAREELHDTGIFSSHDLPKSMLAYLNLSIDDALVSENPIIRAFAMLDRRLGKRRLCNFDSTDEHPLVSQFHHFRCLVEGLRPGQQLTATAASNEQREPKDSHQKSRD